MRLEISIDSMPYMIDTTDPVLLGKWAEEILARAVAGGMTAATYIQVRAQPSYLRGGGEDPLLDWIEELYEADSRIMGERFEIQSLRDLVKGLSKQLDDAEALHDNPA